MDIKDSSALFLRAVCVLTICSAVTAFGEPAPCSLVTQAQVSGVLGVSVGAGQAIGTKGCSWTSTGQTKERKVATATVALASEQEFAGAKIPRGKNVTNTAVSGVGDDAVYTIVGKLASLSVKKGNVAFVVRIYGFPLDQIEAKEKAFALAVLSKL
jgi:hypothetical protein